VRPQLRLVLPLACGLLAILLVLVIVLVGSGGSHRTTTQNGGFDGAAFPANVRAHDFTLSNQQGRRVSLGMFQGQTVVLTFLSTGCRACTLVAQQVRGALDELAEATAKAEAHTKGLSDALPAMQVLFVSTNPRSDSAARVKRFLAETSLTGRAEYLTGTRQQLRAVWRAYRVPPASAGKSASEAATTVLLIDRDGIERVGFGLEQITPEGLSHDIRLLQTG
jgi:protein SCO1/2